MIKINRYLLNAVFIICVPFLWIAYLLENKRPKQRNDGRVTDYNPWTDKW